MSFAKSLRLTTLILVATAFSPMTAMADHRDWFDNSYDRNDDYYRDRDRYELERERDRLDEERYRLQREREELDRERYNQNSQINIITPEHCPSGYTPSEQKCSQEERRRGCKDIRLPGGLGCVRR